MPSKITIEESEGRLALRADDTGTPRAIQLLFFIPLTLGSGVFLAVSVGYGAGPVATVVGLAFLLLFLWCGLFSLASSRVTYLFDTERDTVLRNGRPFLRLSEVTAFRASLRQDDWYSYYALTAETVGGVTVALDEVRSPSGNGADNERSSDGDAARVRAIAERANRYVAAYELSSFGRSECTKVDTDTHVAG